MKSGKLYTGCLIVATKSCVGATGEIEEALTIGLVYIVFNH